MKQISKKIGRFFKKLWSLIKKHKVLSILVTTLILMGIMVGEEAIIEYNEPDEVKYEEFMSDLKGHKIDTIYYSDEEYMRYTLFNDETKEMTRKEREDYKYDKSEWRMTLFPSGEDFRENMLKYDVNLEIKSFAPKSKVIISAILSIALPILLLVLLFRWMMGSAFKKRDNIFREEVNVTFKDVIGHDEVIEDLRFIVDLMKNSDKLNKFNMEVPRGILFCGESGTGKTLLAKAIAGESNVPFFYVNSSNIIELYAGTGAKRIREVFEQAYKVAPCIIFFDEIDAIGGSRNQAMIHSENVQTLNALLQEMDGFKENKGVFVIAATNTADTLDKALLRSGRFDRQIIIPPPKDWQDRAKLFDHYLKGAEFDVDIEVVSKQCVGFTGADVKNIVNEAKLIASMESADKILTQHIEEAIDKRIFKGNKRKHEEHDKETVIVAYHEAGHAVMTYLCGKPMARATIVAQTSGVGGYVRNADDGRKLATKTDLENQIKICYAGRCSEIIKFSESSIGASNDIQQATDIISQYVGVFGFDDRFGMINLGVLGNNGLMLSSEKLIEIISEIAISYEKETMDILKENYNLVERLAQELLIRETLSGDAMLEILSGVKKS